MNIVTKSVAVVLTAAALGGLGAGVASAATPADAAATHAAVAQAAVGQQKLGATSSDFQITNGTTQYQLELLGSSDPANTDGTWASVPRAFVLDPQAGGLAVDLNIDGKTAVQGTLHFFLVDKSTGETGYFDATVGWLDNGTASGQQVIKIQPSTWPGAPTVNPPTDVTVHAVQNDLVVADAS